LKHRFEARRNTRNFAAWNNLEPGFDKDSLSGKEEAVADKVWLENSVQIPEVGFRFRKRDQLAAPNIIKRVWDRFYLQTDQSPIRVSFESVPGVACIPWLKKLHSKIAEDRSVLTSLQNFAQQVVKCRKFLHCQIGGSIEQMSDWLDNTDAAIFYESTWRGWRHEFEDERNPISQEFRKEIDGCLKYLSELLKTASIDKPGRYFAFLSLDGDGIGKTLMGQNNLSLKTRFPSLLGIQTQLQRNSSSLDGTSFKEFSDWLELPSPITKGFHSAFSSALGEFAHTQARTIVKSCSGQLVYAGGDDVLAMLPAETAIDCAVKLRKAFSEAIGKIPGAGKATASVGVAIAHYKNSLQMVVQASHEAQRGAKERGGNALSIALVKRSGETIFWQTPFEKREGTSAALELLQFVQNHSREQNSNPATDPFFSGRFPHRLTEFLQKYETGESKPASDIAKIVEADFNWVVTQQTTESKTERQELVRLGKDYIDQLTSTRSEATPFPIRDFYNLFLIEAFIAQKGE